MHLIHEKFNSDFFLQTIIISLKSFLQVHTQVIKTNKIEYWYFDTIINAIFYITSSASSFGFVAFLTVLV